MRRVRAEDMAELQRLAAADGHAVIRPTHVFVRRLPGEGSPDGAIAEEIIGCCGVASVVAVLPWFDSKRCRAGESVALIHAMENLVALAAAPAGSGGPGADGVCAGGEDESVCGAYRAAGVCAGG
jgi:hypothetical protein